MKMKTGFFLCCYLLLCSLAAKAQTDTLIYYLDGNSQYLNSKDGMETLRMVIKPIKTEKYYNVRDYYKDGKLKLVAQSKKDDGSELDGSCIEYYPNGKRKSVRNYDGYKVTGFYYAYHPNGSLNVILKISDDDRLLIDEMRDSTGKVLVTNGNGKGVDYYGPPLNYIDKGNVVNGKREGEWRRTINDTLKATLFYNNNRIDSGIGYDKAGNSYSFKSIEERAIPDDGFFQFSERLRGKVILPKEARKQNLKGSVVIEAVVGVNGQISDIKVLKGLGYGIDEQVIKLIKEDKSKWIPAKEYGKPIAQTVSFSVLVGYYY